MTEHRHARFDLEADDQPDDTGSDSEVYDTHRQRIRVVSESEPPKVEDADLPAVIITKPSYSEKDPDIALTQGQEMNSSQPPNIYRQALSTESKSERDERNAEKEENGGESGTASYPPLPSPTSTAGSPQKSPSNLPLHTKLKNGFLPNTVPAFLIWIPPKLNWKGLRPVLRGSVAAWCGLLLLLADKSRHTLGNASFLVLIVAIISPAASPIATVLETTLWEFIIVAFSWAYSCIALAIAHSARTEFKLTRAAFEQMAAQPYITAGGLNAGEISVLIQNDIFHGKYMETSSSVVCAIFLGAGGGFLLWLRGFLGPGPKLFGVIFGVIILVISLTIAVLFPYPYYGIGLIFFLPMTCQLAINLLCTFLVFPETLTHQFADRLISTLNPLQSVIQQQKALLKANPRTADWLQFKSIKVSTTEAMGGLALLGTSEANLTREITYGRVSGKDLSKVLKHMRVLVSRTTGFVFFYEIIEKHLHRDYSDSKGGAAADALVIHMGHSATHTSKENTPPSSRNSSPSRSQHAGKQCSDDLKLSAENGTHSNLPDSPPAVLISSPLATATFADVDQKTLPSEAVANLPGINHRSMSHPSSHSDLHYLRSRPRSRARDGLHYSGHRSKTSSHISLPSLLHDVLHPAIEVRPVGLIESQKYMDLEDYLHNPSDEEHIEEIIGLLSSSSETLLYVLDKSVGHLITTIHRLKSTEKTWWMFSKTDDKSYNDAVEESKSRLKELEEVLKDYKDAKRLDVIKPFASLFDPAMPMSENALKNSPSHRGLFWAFSYQFSLMGWGEALVDAFSEVVHIESHHRHPRVLTPEWAKIRFYQSNDADPYADESPEIISGLRPGTAFSAPRNPDYRPATGAWQLAGIKFYNATQYVTHVDVLFGVKSGVLLALISLPAFFQSTSYFFYRERGVWVVIMAALTSNQFVGDTTFQFIIRSIGTLLGAILGIGIWYIGSAHGHGNPYGMAAVCLVAFPGIMFIRVHYQPIPTAILVTVTVILVVGYSWQNAHATPGQISIGWGWDVAWRRFVCVMIGITAAFIWSYVPPKSTQKETVRKTHAKVIGQIGEVLCQTVSFAHCKKDGAKAPSSIVGNLTALRVKVGKTAGGTAMIKFEVSLRGPWPTEHYRSLQTLQIEILDLIGQFLGVVASLDSRWSKALLHRAQFANSRFLGDLLNSLNLISAALRHGTPLPYLYNPLLERFLRPLEAVTSGHPYGYNVVLGEEDTSGLPQHIDMSTICSISYLKFSCGISQCYAIVNRIDRLMIVTKALVGEQYILYGLEQPGEGRDRVQAEMHQHLWDADDSRRNSTEALV